ncbi:MAG: thioredoxin family protein [Arachnia propionica]|uniref:thioredoxin family protein n=1 Tax=Arachnia propionica TaxID=1750 RepID=UPI0027094482|nr:thioredoxin family protein [Arachnia propionica]
MTSSPPKRWRHPRLIGALTVVVALIATLAILDLARPPVTRAPETLSSPQAVTPTAGGTAATREAPELSGIEAWINTDPLSLAELRGKVVLVDFWTYSCINCVRTQPHLNAWYENYHDQGLEIIGVHAPEFAFERLPANVERAVEEAGIRYPVALDNDFVTWRAYENSYWPSRYLIDRDGRIVFNHHGEGAYEETEQRIRDLLQAEGPTTSAVPDGQATAGQTPEIHLGLARTFGYNGTPDLDPQLFDYTPAGELASNQWHLDGEWQIGEDSITALSDGAGLGIRFDGAKLFLVAGGPSGSTVEVRVNGGADFPGQDVTEGVAQVEVSRLHRLVELPRFTTGTLVELRFSAGVTAHALTFGG